MSGTRGPAGKEVQYHPNQADTWFRKLPSDFKDEIKRERRRDFGMALRERGYALVVILLAIFLHAGIEYFVSNGEAQATFIAGVFGCAVGIIWLVLDLGQLSSPVVGAMAYIGQRAFLGGTMESARVSFILGSLVVGCVSFYLGMRRDGRAWE